jgi:hypothetical protein
MDILQISISSKKGNFKARLGLVKMNCYYLIAKDLFKQGLLLAHANIENAVATYEVEPYGEVELESYNSKMMILMKDGKLLTRNYALEREYLISQSLDSSKQNTA